MRWLPEETGLGVRDLKELRCIRELEGRIDWSFANLRVEEGEGIVQSDSNQPLTYFAS